MRFCPHCDTFTERPNSNAGKLFGALAGLAAAQIPVAARMQLGLGVSAFVIGLLIDNTVSRICPACGALLKQLILR